MVPIGHLTPRNLIATLLVTLSVLQQSSAVQDAGNPTPQAAPAAERPAARPNIYDEQADARKLIDAALANAQRDNTRVLVMFGGNWCGWCHKLHELFKSDTDIAHTLLYEYELVMVDVGRFDKHMDIAKAYDADLAKNGVPFLTVLAADGKPLANQETGALERGPQHDKEKVAAFLNKWKAEQRDAAGSLKSALAAAGSDRKVFLHFGAPWCGWCRKLEAFTSRPEIARLLAKDFVELKIDMDRMTGAKEVAARYRKDGDGGIPWFAFLDSRGEPVITSETGGGNIGYPATPAEIGRFVEMLHKVRKIISADDVQVIERALKDAAPPLPTRPAAAKP